MERKALLISLVMITCLVAAAAVNNSTAEDDSEVSITVVSACSVSIPSFEAPNGGFLGRNGTGPFEARIVNNGSFSSTSLNASMEMDYMRNITNTTLKDPEYLNLSDVQEEYRSNFSNETLNYTSDLENLSEFEFSEFSNDTQDFVNRLQVPAEINLTKQENITGNYSKMRDFDNFTANLSTNAANRSTNYVKLFAAEPRYPYGEYNATINVDYMCRVFNSTSGETNRIIDEEDGEDITFRNKTIDFSIVRASGGVAEEGDQSTDETLPRDVDEFGETSDQTVEGDSPNPGQTPRPEPEPEPEPEPDPAPELELEPVNRTYTAERQQDKPIPISARNLGEEAISDIMISPQIQALEGDWQGNNASLSELQPGNRTERSLVVTPPATADPGLYTIPVIATNNESRLDTDYFYVDVKRTSFEPRFEILESPRSVQITEGAEQELPILVQNVGRENLTDVSVEVQNIGECAEVDAESVEMLEPNETTSLSVQVNASNTSQSCESTLLVSSQEGAFAYSNLGVTVSPEEGVIPERQQPPLLAIVWTLMLVGYSVFRKRLDSDSLGVNAPLILLVVGEALIMLYLVVGHYSIISVPFLPF